MKVKVFERRLVSGTPRPSHVRRTVIIVTSVLLSINLTVGFLVAYNMYDIKIWLHDKYGYQAIDPYQSSQIVLQQLPSVLRNAILPRSFTPNYQAIPEIAIDMKFKNIQTLKRKRNEARKVGVLLKADDDFVPATIRVGSMSAKAKVRLKGDTEDHLRGDKLSLRIKIKGDDAVLGLRTFSVHHPRARGFHLQGLLNETLRHVGVLVPRYELVRIKLNGDDLGIMYLDEFMGKEMLESQHRRESVVIRFDENLLWRQLIMQKRKNQLINWADWRLNTYRFRNSRIESLERSKIAATPLLSQDEKIAIGLLRSFVEGKLPAGAVFDSVSMGKYMAVAELWGAYHGMVWNNMRFYYNPITAKLEAIGFDNDVHTRIPVGARIADGAKEQELFQALIESSEIKNEYVKTLKFLQRDLTEGSLLKQLKEVQKRDVNILRSEFYFLGEFDFNELIKRANYLANYFGEEVLEFDPELFPALVQANILAKSSKHYVEIANIVPFSVRINSISWVKVNKGPSKEFQSLDKLQLPLVLPPLQVGERPQFTRLAFDPPKDMAEYQLVFDLEVIGKQSRSKAVAQSYYEALDRRPIPQASVAEQLRQHPFMRVRDSDHSLVVQEGAWRVRGYIVVPQGYTFVVPPGTTLWFEPDGGIISYGPLEINGTTQEPVVLSGQSASDQSSNANGTWQGIAVFDAPGPSKLSHTKILGTTGVHHSGWELTGGVTFYQSDIWINDSEFDGNLGEDAINIIRSEFTFKNVHMANTASDALDSDFSNGRVEHGLFENIGGLGGGDGIDVSGSEVFVLGTRFNNVNDKALSVGEKSVLTAINVTIEDAGIGAASKDGSHLIIENSSVISARVGGLFAYVKKLEYNAASITAKNVRFESTPVHARAQIGSSINIDGTAVTPETINVQKLYHSKSARK